MTSASSGEAGSGAEPSTPASFQKALESEPRFEKLTERAKNALMLAQEEAQRLQHNYIGTEHVLLGLVREGQGVAGRMLTNAGVRLDGVRGSVEAIIGRGDKKTLVPMSLTPRSKQVLQLSIEAARQLNHNYVGTEHLLLGLLDEGGGVGVNFLASMGVDSDRLRRDTLSAVTISQRMSPTGAPKDSVLSCRVSDADLSAIDMLVEAGIRSTRSDAASWLIRAGIEANNELFERVGATVTEIRRLREQAQSMADRIAKAKPDPPAA